MNKLMDLDNLERRVCTMHANVCAFLKARPADADAAYYSTLHESLNTQIATVTQERCGLIVQQGFKVLHNTPEANVTVVFLLDNIPIDSKEITFVDKSLPNREQVYEALYRFDATSSTAQPPQPPRNPEAAGTTQDAALSGLTAEVLAVKTEVKQLREEVMAEVKDMRKDMAGIQTALDKILNSSLRYT
eukprot:NODE_4546_length_773_cov_30.608359_g4523_i0.p1 GENE.NODE_4546_length_773_cov_30.608359_g4523_i0~~NODE_4546_length_773_cov_30.608359_g4523_i0.p1  ORF type:complete len:189 (-),score=26.91 NODE_4546_length_773_cov_30.608359_g4523_i0:100-666(-)